MSRFHPGREELGQNSLVDPKYKSKLADPAIRSGLPVVELAAGDGALSVALVGRCRSLTVVEIDPRRVAALRQRLGRDARVVRADLLSYRLPPEPHFIVANLPFHLTTAAMKRLLVAPHWRQAALLVQWEAARRRAGVGGTSMLTVMWQPWFEFDLVCRVPARAFRPVPSVDGGIVSIVRRPRALVEHRGRYQRFVSSVFRAPGSTVREKLRRSGRSRGRGVPARARPRDLTVEDWVELYRSCR